MPKAPCLRRPATGFYRRARENSAGRPVDPGAGDGMPQPQSSPICTDVNAPMGPDRRAHEHSAKPIFILHKCWPNLPENPLPPMCANVDALVHNRHNLPHKAFAPMATCATCNRRFCQQCFTKYKYCEADRSWTEDICLTCLPQIIITAMLEQSDVRCVPTVPPPSLPLRACVPTVTGKPPQIRPLLPGNERQPAAARGPA